MRFRTPASVLSATWMDYIYVTAVDGTRIPVLRWVVGFGAQIRVDGDGSCRLNSRDAYLVTIVNERRPRTTTQRVKYVAESVREQALDAFFDHAKEVVEEEILPAVLRAQGLNKVASFVFYGAELLASWPVAVLQAVFFDSTSIGDEPTWHAYRQPLPRGNSALIRWLGDPN
ncbi:MAG TPA: hypothetical protein VMV69_06065 [Pirellulales bacterium]|nr:hypothetical protein [Pirellulales bacterium]